MAKGAWELGAADGHDGQPPEKSELTAIEDLEQGPPDSNSADANVPRPADDADSRAGRASIGDGAGDSASDGAGNAGAGEVITVESQGSSVRMLS
eukprot:CAMPEP_0182541144 /NCGR_PEP_ID=MMETSP1323-20130603/28190_1 /TAXON_ID=236787 /ORGANISM="Florenciella parvula, Strain RCC1693" /LENGTH=94 /DNA_ID=CAMNT_0024751873 /DNA_START=28 /DNA_END=309 /DNA_ORIENTATION=+